MGVAGAVQAQPIQEPLNTGPHLDFRAARPHRLPARVEDQPGPGPVGEEADTSLPRLWSFPASTSTTVVPTAVLEAPLVRRCSRKAHLAEQRAQELGPLARRLGDIDRRFDQAPPQGRDRRLAPPSPVPSAPTRPRRRDATPEETRDGRARPRSRRDLRAGDGYRTALVLRGRGDAARLLVPGRLAVVAVPVTAIARAVPVACRPRVVRADILAAARLRRRHGRRLTREATVETLRRLDTAWAAVGGAVPSRPRPSGLLEFGSKDSADSGRTTHVLMIMLAEEP